MLLSLEGRASRREFWLVVGPVLLWNAGLIGALEVLAPDGVKALPAALAVLIFGMMAPDFLGIAAIARRLHDLGQSAMWICGAGLAVRIAQAAYRWIPAGLGRLVIIVAGTLAFGACIAWLGGKTGVPGPNEHGPDPLGAPDPPERAAS